MTALPPPRRPVVVVTGGGGDIGRALAVRYVAEEADVHLLDRSPDVVGTAEALGASGHPVDMTDPEAVAAVFAVLSRVDLLVTAVGHWPLLTLDELTPARWKEQLSINLDSTYFAVHAAREALRAASGSVVCIASAVGLKGHAQMISYAAAKSGVMGLVRALALALGPDGVRVNSVAPGLVLTERMAELWGPERTAAFRATRAVDRDIHTEDVVAAVHYLGSPAARAVTGQTLVVDGGTVMH
ncbi:MULTISPECIES: SDR family NAD(P)-dependent oxidoreductase [unclassified Modestobacter]